jgi:hypothetical protein
MRYLPLALPCALLACAETEKVEAPPTSWEYQINFLSKDAAISADTIEVTIFDASTPNADCQQLVQRRRTKQQLPAAFSGPTSLSLCDALSSPSPTATTPYGDYSVLVVAKRGSKDWLIGCQLQQVSEQAPALPLPIGLTPFDNTVQIQPAPGCASLSQYCQGQCQRP